MLTAGVCVRMRACIRKANNFMYKVSSYIAQYPILLIAQSALHTTSLADPASQFHVAYLAATNVYLVLRRLP